MSYKIETIQMDFPENDLAAGAELIAMEQVALTVSNIESEDDTKEVLRKAEIDILDEDEKEQSCIYNAGKPYVIFDDKYGELVKTRCGCQEFNNSGKFSCRHIAAAILAYIRERDGLEVLASSRIETILAKKTGIEHPFLPGILRKTERDLSEFLQWNQQEEKKLIRAVSQTAGNVQVVCMVQPQSEGLAVEVKVGEKRLYVVKNLNEFLTSCFNKEPMLFGKSYSFIPVEEVFTKEAWAAVAYFQHLYRENSLNNGRIFYRGYSGMERRSILLTGQDLDQFMETVACYGICLLPDEKKKYFYYGKEKKPALEMQKLTYGAVFKMKPFPVLAKSLEWEYVLEGDEICRIALAVEEKEQKVFDLLQTKEEVFVSEKDLPAACRDFLPRISSVMDVTYHGINPEDYLPQKPVFEIYLDYPQENMVSCKAFAVYKENKYQLYRKEDYTDNRDFSEEYAVGEAIGSHFNAFDEKKAMFYFEGDEAALFDFLSQDIEALRALGEVFISDRLKRLQVVSLSGTSIGVSIESGLMELKITSNVFSKNELAEILSSYDRKKKYYRLKNGMFVAYHKEQGDMWSALSDCMQYANKKNVDRIQMPLFRALYLDEMLKEKEEIQYSKNREYRKLLANMNSVKNGDFEIPKKLEGILRNYQRDGFFWLKTLKANGFCGILADDMGLGKTLQVLAFLLSEKQEGKSGEKLRTLIVTPASLVYNWKHEIEQFVPQLRAAVISGSAAERRAQIQLEAANEKQGAEIWITSYDLLKRDVELYKKIHFANEVVDEAQYIKNQTTHASKSVRLINSSFRIALTGTPIENRLSEIWSIFDYLMPGFLFTYARFRKEIEIPVVANQDEEAMEKMRRMISPFVLRRLKKDVLKELPEKQEETVIVSMSGEQKKLYQAHVQRLKMYLDKQSEEEFTQNKLQVLAELTKLRQICCGPELLFEDYNAENAKLEACMELVHQAISGGHKVLLFSQFTSMLDEITKQFTADGVEYYRIDGSVKKEARAKMVDAFQAETNQVPVFCISLKAGGTGLNLTAADIVIHYDPWWNLAAQNQATDRAHRIGQKNAVNVYQLIAEDTIEQKIQELQRSKHQLAQEVLSGEGIQSITIDKSEVMALLGEE